MFDLHAPERLAETMHHLCRHWESRRERASDQEWEPHPLTIAISREEGTRGTLIAEEVGKLLGWHVYDRELLEQIAHDMSLPIDLLESVDERHRSWLLEVADAFMSAPLITESGYVHHLVKKVSALAAHGECVIVGRGAAFFLAPATTLRVRLVAPLRDRIAILRQNLNVSELEAARQLRITDQERSDFVRNHFFRDPSDPRCYDLIMNVSCLSVAEIAQVVVDTVHRIQMRRTEKNAVPSRPSTDRGFLAAAGGQYR